MGPLFSQSLGYGDGAIDAAALYQLNGNRKYLNQTERSRVLASAASLPVERELFILVLAWSGARISEVLALTASSFQIERGVVSIRTLKRRRHSVREVPLPPDLLVRIAQHFRLHEMTVSENSRRLWPWCRQTGWRIVKRVMARAGVSGAAASPRGLRHAFGVTTLQAQVPLYKNSNHLTVVARG